MVSEHCGEAESALSKEAAFKLTPAFYLLLTLLKTFHLKNRHRLENKCGVRSGVWSPGLGRERRVTSLKPKSEAGKHNFLIPPLIFLLRKKKFSLLQRIIR